MNIINQKLDTTPYNLFPMLAEDYYNLPMHSDYLENNFGEEAVDAFAIGTMELLDYLTYDMRFLANLPEGTHMGQLPCSSLKTVFPEQFLTNYDYNFYSHAKSQVIKMLEDLDNFKLETTFDKILFYVIIKLGYNVLDYNPLDYTSHDKSWVSIILPDFRILTCFSEGSYCDKKNTYHFNNWNQKTEQ